MPNDVPIRKKLGFIKPNKKIKAGNVLLFGSENLKSHKAIDISDSMALEAYKHYKNCNGIPIQTRNISQIRNNYPKNDVCVVNFYKKDSFRCIKIFRK